MPGRANALSTSHLILGSRISAAWPAFIAPNSAKLPPQRSEKTDSLENEGGTGGPGRRTPARLSCKSLKSKIYALRRIDRSIGEAQRMSGLPRSSHALVTGGGRGIGRAI